MIVKDISGKELKYVEIKLGPHLRNVTSEMNSR